MTSATVIIGTHNRAGLLEGVLAAIEGQRTSPGLRWDLVVVDNNSTDGTKAVIEAFRARVQVPTTYTFEARQGINHARNTGVSAATGELLVFTDDDCRPAPTWLQDVMEAIRRWNADGVGGRILPQWSAPPPPWLAHEQHLWTTLAMLTDTEVRRVEIGPRQRAHGFRLWGANMSFRRSAFEAVGGFDPDCGPQGKKKYSGGDIEFVRRVIEAGKVVMFDPAPTVWHWVGPERMRKSYFRTHAFYYGEGAALRNGPPRGQHLFGVPAFLLRALGGHGAAWLRAALRRDPETFCYEREIHEALGYLSGYVKCALRRRQYARLSGRDPRYAVRSAPRDQVKP
jgi:glycosyltransferase involved in cell wall biosynthesis